VKEMFNNIINATVGSPTRDWQMPKQTRPDT
jgi:hypothetical protein